MTYKQMDRIHLLEARIAALESKVYRLLGEIEWIAESLEQQEMHPPQPVVVPAGSVCVIGPGYREYVHPDGRRTIFGNPTT